MPRAPSPLKDEHCQMCDRAQEQARAALELAAKCAECGINMDAEIAQLRAQLDIAEKLKRTFFPERV